MRKSKITDYKPDPANPNKHTERGVRMLEDSVANVGLGRSIVVDKNGYVIAGNSTQERAVDQGFEDAIEIETDGKQLVVVKRTDLDLLSDDQKARLMSYYDNRAAETGIDWDAEQLMADLQSGFDFDGLFRDDELDGLMDQYHEELFALGSLDSEVGSARSLGDKKQQVKPVLYVDEIATFEKAMSLTGLHNRGESLMEICRVYIEQFEERQFDIHPEEDHSD